MFDRKTLTQGVGELLGTAILASAMFAMINGGFGLFATAIVAGLTLAVLVAVFGPISGAHVNPAVTLGLWTLNKIESSKTLVYLAAQFLGGLGAWWLLSYLTNAGLSSLTEGAFDWRVFIAEAVAAAVFLFAVSAAIKRESSNSQLAAVAGGGFLVAVIIAGLASNGIVNPAVALSVQSWDWTYAVAPVVGGAVGANLYSLVLAPAEASSRGRRKK